jgi:hypothetical protein
MRTIATVTFLTSSSSFQTMERKLRLRRGGEGVEE